MQMDVEARASLEKGLRFNHGKPEFSKLHTTFVVGLLALLERGIRLDLLPFSLIIAVADILTGGARKYAERNWEKGMEWSSVFNSTMRHLLKWYFLAEDVDTESGKPHTWHIASNVAFLIEFEKTHREFDDRPKADASLAQVYLELFGLTDEATQ